MSAVFRLMTSYALRPSALAVVNATHSLRLKKLFGMVTVKVCMVSQADDRRRYRMFGPCVA